MILRFFFLCTFCCFFAAFSTKVCAGEVDPEAAAFLGWLKQEKVELYGSVELEFNHGEDFSEPGEHVATASNWDATLDLGLLLKPVPWLTTVFAITWDDENPVEIEDAFLTLGDPEQFPFSVTGGKLTLPFGRYETAMLSDSLPQEIGETIEEAAVLGLTWQGLQMAVYAFDGAKELGDAGNGLSPYGADIRYHLEDEDFELVVGGSWIENLANSDGLSDFYAEEDLLLQNQVPGLAAYSQLTLGAVTLAAEYIESLSRPEVVADGETEKLDRQIAWAAELAVVFEVSEIELGCALSYGESSGLGDLLPKTRYGVAVSVWPQDYLRLVVEHLRDEDYSVTDGGTGDQANFFAINLAAEF